jgi:hypothetical protein
MEKIVKIFYCGDCPFRFYDGNDLCCELTENDKVIYENASIPDWCPLPDDKYIKKER